MRRRKPVAALADPERGDVVVESLFEVLDREHVRAALDGLHPRHQTALSLWAEGYASRHIAEELGCSRGAADVTLHRARQSFRRQFLALTGEGKLGAFGALGLGPALARWAQRWRVRIASRVGEHADLFSPLAAKAVAGAIAFSVVGGAVATANSAPTARATVPAAVRSAPANDAHPGPSPAVAVRSAAPDNVASATSPSAATPPAESRALPSESGIAPKFMSSDEAKARGQNAPIRAEVPGVVGLAVDPKPIGNGLVPSLSNREKQ
jgi:DNA-binding CsgD family transcriptional regulator